MRRFITLFFFIFTLSGVAVAQMTDDQVIQFLKTSQAQGMSQKQMTTELLKRGVTVEQAQKLKDKYSNMTGEDNASDQNQKSASASRLRNGKSKSKVNESGRVLDEEEDNSMTGKRNDRNQRTQKKNTSLQKNRLKSYNNKTDMYDEMSEMEFDEDQEEYMSGMFQKKKEEDPTKQIFGHNIFTNKNLTFEPNVNIATPVNYRLGAGDEVIIDVWGASEKTIRQTISPEGSIQVTNLGPVFLNGMTVKEANSHLEREFAKKYAGISGTVPSSQIKLTLGETRMIQVNVMGEVAVPGTYTLSPFASVFHALYNAGGVNKIGSLRSIKVVRNGKVIADLDVYGFIMKGKMKDDIRLQEGDVILVNPYDCLVQITGKVKRPMFYEMKNTETVSTLLKYSGGFAGDAYKKAIRLIRKTGREHQVYNVDEMDYSVFKLEDGDELSVDSVLARFENRVEVRGAVYRAGMYQLDGTVNTVKQLIKKAEGIRGDAFMNRVIIERENENLTREIIPIDLRGLLEGTVVDIPLQRNDVLYIPSVYDMKEEALITIHGEIANPGTYLFANKMTVEDLVIKAGGLLEAASTARINVSRRIKNSSTVSYSNLVGETFSFELKDGLVVGDNDFYLEPFDEVYIRRSPAYHEQQNVMVAGEVLYSGSYALSKKNERLSDLVTKAGGVTPDAYIKGTRLIRQMTDEEIRRRDDALQMAQKDRIKGDTILLEQSDFYSVGINLEKALAHPGSDYDMVLREGDALYIPEFVSTVKISGAVMYPNTVLYKPGEKLDYYVDQAGGFDRAKKSKAFAVYMNGTVTRLRKGRSKTIEPGCEIIIPSKGKKNGMSAAEIVGMGTSFASMATMVATMVNIFK